jgi:hypothetical protein
MTKIKANNGKFYTLPANPVWHSGPPPENGWWPSSPNGDAYSLRFWNGECWSWGALPSMNPKQASFWGNIASNKPIKWCARWWE